MLRKGAVLWLILSLAVASLCTCDQASPQPTETLDVVPTLAEPTPLSPDLPAPTASTGLLTVRESVLAYVRDRFPVDAPPASLVWLEERATPPGLIGSETYRYSTEGWVLTISYPVTDPASVVYNAVLVSLNAPFQWQGQVDGNGRVIEGEPELHDAIQSVLDAALAHLRAHSGASAPEADLTWTRARTTPQGMLGSETYEYRSGPWQVQISYPVVAPESIRYSVVVANGETGYRWQGELDSKGALTKETTTTDGRPAIGWYGRVVDGRGDDPLQDGFVPDGEDGVQIGLKAADTAVADLIDSFKGSIGGVHVWGTLVCDDAAPEGCFVRAVRAWQKGSGTSVPEPDPVDRWQGTVVSNPEASPFDDHFLLAGDIPVRYGIASSEPALAAQLQSMRDSGTTIGVWGQLSYGMPDINDMQIEVIAIEVVGIPGQPTSLAVDGWTGKIVPRTAGQESGHRFERSDGQQFAIDALEDDLKRGILALGTTGSRIRIWGHLETSTPASGMPQVRLERYELEPITEAVEGWTGILKALPPGGQYDDCFEREDGQLYGIASTDAKLELRLGSLLGTAVKVRVWGELSVGVPDVENRQILVTEIELLD